MTELARTVVYRHRCSCDSASVQSTEDVHVFDVDGKPFPFFITTDGPKFTQLEGGLFEVAVTIIGLMSYDEPHFVVGPGHAFRINGVAFPWHVSKAGITYRSSDIATVSLAFLAQSVDHDQAIE